MISMFEEEVVLEVKVMAESDFIRIYL